jgi:hypothetical protein
MRRFALHRQSQNTDVCALGHAMACRGFPRVLPNCAGPCYRLPDLNVSPSTDRRKDLLPARSDRVSTLGEIR